MRQESETMRLFRERTDKYKSLREQGFDITQTRQYYADAKTERAHVESYMKTPYFYHGKPVDGYAITDVSDKQRPSHMIEFWQDGRNVEDISMLAGEGGKIQLTDKNGVAVDMKEARENVAGFASGASEYPHVFTYPEYVEARTPINERMHLDPPNEEAYGHYLESVERQLASRDIHFVGEITKVSDLSKMYESMPGVQNMYEEAHKDSEISFE